MPATLFVLFCVLYFLDCKTQFPPPQIWEENGGVSYNPNIAYLGCCGGGVGSGGGAGVFFFLFSSSKT